MRMDALRGPDAATLLIRALRTHAAASGCPIHLVTVESHGWASATFTGMQHRVTIAADPVPGLRSWLDALPEAELELHGHIVADLAIDALESIDGRTHISIAALTLINA